MARTLEIPDLSEEALRYLETRAAEERMTIEAYVRRDLEAMASRRSVLDELASLPPVKSSESSEEMIRHGREERDHDMERWQSAK
jgi:alpha-galactosidase/6-phospho-beta-glucosidase family protein